MKKGQGTAGSAVWSLAFPCGHRVYVGERVSSRCPVWCETCARAYSEPCHQCAPCDLCRDRRRPAKISRCLIVRLDERLNQEIEALQITANRRGRRSVPLAELARDLLWRGLNEARRWRHPAGARVEENPAQRKLFEEE